MKVRLAQIADVQIGYQVRGRILSGQDDTHLLVQAGDVTEDGEILWEKLASFRPDRKSAMRYSLLEGDVLFLAKGVKRVAAIVRNPRPGTLTSSTFYILRVRDDAVALPEYLAWYLNAAGRQDVSAMELRGTTIAFVPKEALLGLEVELPPTFVQRKVAAVMQLLSREKTLSLDLLERRAKLVTALAERAITHKED